MAKYNPKNEQHRKWLAQRVLKVVLGYGYVMDFTEQSQELTFYRKTDTGEVRVFTSIDKRSGAMRYGGTDAIRVLASCPTTPTEVTGGNIVEISHSRLRFNRNIHRRGTFDTIAKRVAEALRIANWNIENPDKPRWDGTAKPKRRRGKRIRKK